MQPLEIKSLLEAGTHFGHQCHKWNPKMKKYVYGEKNGIYIIDLVKTVELAKKAADFVQNVSASGAPVLFVGTKRQATEVVQKSALNCGAHFVVHRWLGGMLTNYKTIFLSIDKLRKIEKMKETGDFALLTKKEQAHIEKTILKLERNLGGIKNMRRLPGAVFIVDPGKERIAVKEANTLGIPVVAITDTNCDPEGISYVVPGNDDALKSITILTEYIANAVVEGSRFAKRERSKEEMTERDFALEKEVLEKFEHDIDLQQEEDEDYGSSEEA